MTKVIKPMYLFFDWLYESTDLIGEETLSDWSHKERPTLQYCIMDTEDAEYKEIDASYIYLADSMEEAEEILSEEY